MVLNSVFLGGLCFLIVGLFRVQPAIIAIGAFAVIFSELIVSMAEPAPKKISEIDRLCSATALETETDWKQFENRAEKILRKSA